jgi:hypothetical protein
MFFRKKDIPDFNSLLDRLSHLENFLKNLSSDSYIRKQIEEEIEKINSMLRVYGR